MTASLWGRWLAAPPGRRPPRPLRPPSRPWLEVLEDRSLLSSFHVTNVNDGGPGSLRQAILDANAAAGSGRNIIDFTPKVTGPIDLLSALPALDNDVTLRGPGSNTATVERSSAAGTPNFRIFTVNPGRSVQITGLTVANGRVTGDVGGGILNQGTLDLENSVVTGNTSLRNASFAGGRGGGIENTGTLTVHNSQITGNNAFIFGGGLHNTAGGTTVLDHAEVSDNTCISDGAGIRSEVGTALTITDSVISGNSASGFGTGGIASGATLTIRNTLIANNKSAAAGMYLMGFTRGGDVLISHSVIRDNGPSATSGAGVGGIWSFSESTIRIEDTSITHNTGNTGGFFGLGKLEMVRSSVSDNSGTGIDSLGFPAGGMIADSTISGNVGARVGGIEAGQMQIVRSTISGNTAVPRFGYTGAGGILSDGGTQIDNSTISGNTVDATNLAHYHSPYSDYGGAAGGVLALFPGVTIDHSTIAFNKVVNAAPDLGDVSGGVASAHFTSYYAGNTYSYEADVGVRNTIIARNEANVGGPDVSGPFVSAGHNLIGVLGAEATGFVDSDLRGTAGAPLDPLLLPLADNGGPTRTHALARGSPAVNAGDNSDAPPTDQRGRNRIVAGVIDIGAFESAGGGQSSQSTAGTAAPAAAPALLPGRLAGGTAPGVVIVPGGPGPTSAPQQTSAGPSPPDPGGLAGVSAPTVARLLWAEGRHPPPGDPDVRDFVFQDYAGPPDLRGP